MREQETRLEPQTPTEARALYSVVSRRLQVGNAAGPHGPRTRRASAKRRRAQARREASSVDRSDRDA